MRTKFAKYWNTAANCALLNRFVRLTHRFFYYQPVLQSHLCGRYLSDTKQTKNISRQRIARQDKKVFLHRSYRESHSGHVIGGFLSEVMQTDTDEGGNLMVHSKRNAPGITHEAEKGCSSIELVECKDRIPFC
jgi:hypothetical protein